MAAGKRTTEDSYSIRRAALDYHIPYTTTVSGAAAWSRGCRNEKKIGVQPVQYFTGKQECKLKQAPRQVIYLP
jgi:carbamoyl-phosphate synthase large subunit